jgi:micrococcal nuclease
MLKTVTQVFKWLLSIILIGCPTAIAQVLSVHDGDTFTYTRFWPYKPLKTRIWGIDTPELKQPYGPEAGQALRRIIQGQRLTLEPVGKSYSRTVCKVYTLSGQDVGLLMVRAGWARDSKKYSNGAYLKAEQDARKAKRGMWRKGEALESPWQYRQRLKSGR